ncbi:MAG: hypothetical protein AAGA65_23820, partial [Actinomycetota bacterium]
MIFHAFEVEVLFMHGQFLLGEGDVRVTLELPTGDRVLSYDPICQRFFLESVTPGHYFLRLAFGDVAEDRQEVLIHPAPTKTTARLSEDESGEYVIGIMSRQRWEQPVERLASTARVARDQGFQPIPQEHLE